MSLEFFVLIFWWHIEHLNTSFGYFKSPGTHGSFAGNNQPTSVLKRWRKPGDITTVQQFNSNFYLDDQFYFAESSDAHYSDASYLRLKNIEIGYTFNRNIGVKNLRVFASGQNLLTSTKYTGLDPESTSLIDRGTYPQSKAFIIGAKIQL